MDVIELGELELGWVSIKKVGMVKRIGDLRVRSV